MRNNLDASVSLLLLAESGPNKGLERRLTASARTSRPLPAAAQACRLGDRMIDRILRALFVRRAPAQPASEEQLMNYALDLAQEWGPQWMKPIQERLRNVYPTMSEAELNHLDAIARAAMDAGHGYSMAEKHGRKNVDRAQWQSEYAAHYSWVDEKNLNHLYSTGMYYAMKDLG